MHSENLTFYFRNHVFRIPDYQRGYSWGEKQLNELWDDLEEITNEKGHFKQHYTGTIYLEETNPPASETWYTGSKFYNVVDGQQRLTTISILLFELIKAIDIGYLEESKEDLTKTYLYRTNLSGNSKVYKFSYTADDKNFHFLLNKIFEDDSIVLQDDTLNIYRKNLLYAKDFFSQKISSLDTVSKESIFKKITTSLQFDRRLIEEDLDVQAVFETMNNRGKPLSTLERLKNRLIYLTEKLNSPKEDNKNLRGIINNSWAKIYYHLGQDPNFILNEDEFLSAHLSLYRKPNDYVFSESLAEDKIFKMFCNRSNKFQKDNSGEFEESVDYKKIESYVLDLSYAAPFWAFIHSSKSKTIKKISLLDFRKEIKIFLLSVLTKYPYEKGEIIFEKLEKVLFRNRIPGLWVFDERTTATWGRDVINKSKDIDEIEKTIDEIISTKISNESLINSMNNLFTYERGNKGFYRWSTLKYFLFEYDTFLKTYFNETNEKVDIEEYEETHIEHILPNKYSWYWQNEVDDLTNNLENCDKEFAKKVLINTLGNLTILKMQKNCSLKNDGWNEKRSRYKTGSYNEIAISKNENWSKKEILERGMSMLDFMEKKVCGLQLTTIERKKLLFMNSSIIEVISN